MPENCPLSPNTLICDDGYCDCYDNGFCRYSFYSRPCPMIEILTPKEYQEWLMRQLKPSIPKVTGLTYKEREQFNQMQGEITWLGNKVKELIEKKPRKSRYD